MALSSFPFVPPYSVSSSPKKEKLVVHARHHQSRFVWLIFGVEWGTLYHFDLFFFKYLFFFLITPVQKLFVVLTLLSYCQKNNKQDSGPAPSTWPWSCAGCTGVCNLICAAGLLWPCQRFQKASLFQKETLRPESPPAHIGSQDFFLVLSKAYQVWVNAVGITKDINDDGLRYFPETSFLRNLGHNVPRTSVL